jgi:hypothetical protein
MLKGEDLDWIRLIKDGVQWWEIVNTVMNLRVAWKVVNFLTSWATTSFSKTQVQELVESKSRRVVVVAPLSCMFVPYLTTLSQLHICVFELKYSYEWWIGRELRGSVRNLFENTVHGFAWRDQRKRWKGLCVVAGVRAKTRIQDFPIMN